MVLTRCLNTVIARGEATGNPHEGLATVHAEAVGPRFAGLGGTAHRNDG